MRRPVSVLLAAAAGLCGLAGCGDDGTQPDEAAAAAVRTLLAACAAGDGETALGVLNPPARLELLEAPSPREGCARVLELGEDLPPVALPHLFEEAFVAEVAADGGFAEATVRTPEGRESLLELEQAGMRWRITSFTPSA